MLSVAILAQHVWPRLKVVPSSCMRVKESMIKHEMSSVNLNRIGLLDASAVLVHGLAIDRAGVNLMRERGASLIVCPSSNEFLFERLPDMRLLAKLKTWPSVMTLH